MRVIAPPDWHPALYDPSGTRADNRNGQTGLTMVIDKGMGPHAFADFLQTAGAHIDIIKLAFGTSVLYPTDLLKSKLQLARSSGLIIMPGGTLLEAAIAQHAVASYLDTICELGFNGLEVSDGTIELNRKRRTELIKEGLARGLHVVTEYGKKEAGASIDADELAFTAHCDLDAGSALVTVEARESGINVGLFDELGNCRQQSLQQVLKSVPDSSKLMWEAPLKGQQVELLQQLGAEVHLGNIAPADAMALEAMRRGLRSDTFKFGIKADVFDYMI